MLFGGYCSSGCVRTPELGPSTSGTGTFQKHTGLLKGTNVGKRKSSEVSVQPSLLKHSAPAKLLQIELHEALLLLESG